VRVPPATLNIFWCNHCGRTEVYNPYRHYYQGKWCPGKVLTLSYAKQEEEK